MPEPVDTSSAASGRWAAISNAEYLRKWLGLGIAIGTRRRLKTDPVSTRILTPFDPFSAWRPVGVCGGVGGCRGNHTVPGTWGQINDLSSITPVRVQDS